MSNGANNTVEITRNVEDALTFPILTKEVNGSSAGADLARTGVPGGTSLGRLVQDSIRGVLGWRYRADDVKGFTAALTKSFQLREVEGHVEWDFKPQFYMIQADLGEITGAQASIYTRAKVALDQTLPLLDGLKPLRADVDDEDVQAMRAIVRTELSELVQELGTVGGPRVQRGDSIFGLLLGEDPGSHYHEPENVAGQLGELRDRLGLERQRVNTIEEEQNFTNFIILVDYTNSLHQTWISQRGFFVRDSSDPFLGTELVLLSQLLEVIAESVRDAESAMDSVNFGTAERQTTELLLTLDGGEPHPMTVAELLDWVENFAIVEGRQLLQDGGKDGVVVFRFTLSRLLQLINQAFEISRQPSGNPTRGYHTARVRSALEEIKLHLTSALGRANKLDRSQIAYVEEPKPDDQKFPPILPVPPEPRPIILEISPATGKQGATVPAEIKGRHFRNPGVALGDGISLTIILPPTPDKISVSIHIAGDAEPGFRNLVVTNADGSWAELVGFEVLPPDDNGDAKPQIERISPDSLQQGGEQDEATVEGTNLPLGGAVNLGEGVSFSAFDWKEDVITGILKVDPDAPPGKRNLKVFSDGTPSVEKAEVFTVKSGECSLRIERSCNASINIPVLDLDDAWLTSKADSTIRIRQKAIRKAGRQTFIDFDTSWASEGVYDLRLKSGTKERKFPCAVEIVAGEREKKLQTELENRVAECNKLVELTQQQSGQIAALQGELSRAITAFQQIASAVAQQQSGSAAVPQPKAQDRRAAQRRSRQPATKTQKKK
jgi:hypothetical protein